MPISYQSPDGGSLRSRRDWSQLGFPPCDATAREDYLHGHNERFEEGVVLVPPHPRLTQPEVEWIGQQRFVVATPPTRTAHQLPDSDPQPSAIRPLTLFAPKSRPPPIRY
jgi:hypothetical protein